MARWFRGGPEAKAAQVWAGEVAKQAGARPGTGDAEHGGESTAKPVWTRLRDWYWARARGRIRDGGSLGPPP